MTENQQPLGKIKEQYELKPNVPAGNNWKSLLTLAREAPQLEYLKIRAKDEKVDFDLLQSLFAQYLAENPQAQAQIEEAFRQNNFKILNDYLFITREYILAATKQEIDTIVFAG